MKKLAALLAVFCLGTIGLVGQTFAQIALSSGGATRIVESAYIVYDQTGKTVGTTKDGREVLVRVQGHEGKIFVLRNYGGSIRFERGHHLYYSELDCVGQPFYPNSDPESDGDPSLIEGAERLIRTARLDPVSGGWLYDDPDASRIQLMIRSSSGEDGECANNSHEATYSLAGLLNNDFDWVTPLTVIKPQ